MLVLNEVISQDKTSGSIMMSKSQSSKNLTQTKAVNKSIEKKAYPVSFLLVLIMDHYQKDTKKILVNLNLFT